MTKNLNSRKDKKAQFTKKGAASKKKQFLPRWSILLVIAVVGLGLGIWAAAGALYSAAPGDEPADIIAVTSLAPASVAATLDHDPYPLVVATDGEIRLPVGLFEDAEAHHFTYMAGSKPIEFFVLQSADGTVRAAYNACDVCFQARRGYVQEGDTMVCMNCGRRFPSDQINVVQGGCNPAPLERKVDGDLVILKEADIAQGARFF